MAEVLANTTDTPSGAETPLDQLPMRDYIEAREDQIFEKNHPEPQEGEPQRKPLSKWDRRINKMHAKWKTAETRAETAERQAAELQAQIAGNVREQAPQSETEAREAFNRRHLEAAKDHPQRMAAARQKYADFDQSLKTVSVPMAVFPMIRELPNGPEVAYYLAKHPEDAQSLAKLSGVEMFRRIDRLSGALEHEQTQRERNAARERNKPPAPISTVGASSSRTSIPLDELPVGEYIRRRNKQERERR